MPDVTDAPEGVHPHVKIDFVPNHPDGEIRMWVKGRFHVMPVAEAKALAQALYDAAEALEKPPAPPVLEPVTPDIVHEVLEDAPAPA